MAAIFLFLSVHSKGAGELSEVTSDSVPFPTKTGIVPSCHTDWVIVPILWVTLLLPEVRRPESEADYSYLKSQEPE
jgi:hypothetical protein